MQSKTVKREVSYFNRRNIVKSDWFSAACFIKGVSVKKM